MVKETNISINSDRLWDSLMTMAKIGPGIAGGNNRQTVTAEDGEARKLLQKWSEEATKAQAPMPRFSVNAQ